MAIRRSRSCCLAVLLIASLVAGAAPSAIKVACIGDSITYGVGAIEEGHPGATYPAVLQTLLGGSYEVGNFGASGSTLLRRGSLGNGAADAYVNREQFVPSRAFGADILLIMLGTNAVNTSYTFAIVGFGADHRPRRGPPG